MFDDLKGRAVLVTGASTGIGAAVARGFGRAGARVAVHYRRSGEAAEAVADAVSDAGGEAILVKGDVTDRADVKRIVEETVGAFGALDVLINNAGDIVFRKKLEETSDDEIDFVIDLNARAVVSMCRAALPHLRKSKGNIITTTSVAARQSGGPGTGIYTAAKGFAQSLTRFLARDLAPDGVRVNAVAPGFILTPLQDRNTTDEQKAQMTKLIPLGRAGLPEDLVGSYLFLASDRLAGWITGATIDVNGGQYLS
ncbi:MAG TPA: glucose 1-dehydrogenase [Geminicoccaceae bacterium]